MINELRDRFRACMQSQVTHWDNLNKIEYLLTDSICPHDAHRLYERIKDLIAMMCIEVKDADTALDRRHVPDEDIDAVVLNAAEEMDIELPGTNLPQDRFS